jgi:hypothetical protein
MLTFAARELVRELLERGGAPASAWKRILIAGSGELGRLVADKIIEHRELGYQIVGFVDDRRRRSPRLPRCRCSAPSRRRPTSPHARQSITVHRAPAGAARPDAGAIESTSRECVDVKVVPDSLAGHRCAPAEDPDGLRSSTSTTSRSRAFNAIVKRGSTSRFPASRW